MTNNGLKMRLKILLAFVLVAGLYPHAAADAQGKTVKITVTVSDIQLARNDSVGNEWVTKVYVNGKAIGKTVTWEAKPSDTVKLKAYAEEQDKLPDIGTKELAVKLSSFQTSVDKKLNVVVKENRGRYSGNTAEWQFTFKIEKK